MLSFLNSNKRWLGAGFVLTFASGFGQTWYISLFAGVVQDRHGLSDGDWGALYTVATLGAAALMFWRGGWADTVPFAKLVPRMTLVFAACALLFALAPSVWVLGLAVLGLRFCGQGMFSHMAMTAMGRWFAARRGQAVAIASLGYPTAEITLPLVAVLAIAALGWQTTWMLAAAVLALPLLFGLRALFTQTRTQQSTVMTRQTPGLQGRHWQRSDAVRHWLLPALVPVLLTPGFIGTVIFFHQVHLSEDKGWTLLSMTPGYTFYAGFAVLFSFACGWLSDRIGPHRLLPAMLVPMGLGIALVGPAQSVGTWYIALALIGMTQGISKALDGVLFPRVYGTQHLGAIRSLTATIMVISTAIGPGITGALIDRGISFAQQCLAMGLWCAVLSVVCLFLTRRLGQEIAAN